VTQTQIHPKTIFCFHLNEKYAKLDKQVVQGPSRNINIL